MQQGLNLSWSKLFAPHNVVWGGGGGRVSGPPTNSWTLCSNNFKLGGVLGLLFEVSKMLELMYYVE